MNALDKLVISAKLKAASAKDSMKEFLSSEKGVSNVVATIIILLITVLLIVIFWGRLKEWLGDIMDTIFDSTGDLTNVKELEG